jgi:hypothetical protein
MSRKTFTRRTLLRGAGATLALPWLHSLHAPTARAADPLAPPTRLLFYYTPNGMHMPAWTPSTAGADYELPAILTPLSGLKDDLLVLSGLDNLLGKPDGAGDHAGGTSAFLTCAHAKKTEGADIDLGISVDQVAANAIGEATARPSMQLGMEGGASTGGCDSGYSCAYSRNISWASPQTPLPKLVSPQLVFDRLFGAYDAAESAEAAEKRRQYRMSVLDFVMADAQALKPKLAKTDQHKVEEYFDAVRALEIQLEAGPSELICDPGKSPGLEEWSLDERSALMNALMVLAFQCDQTRVISYMFGNAGNNWSFPFLGVSGAHHEISHHQNLEENFQKLTVIDTWEVARFADLVARLKAVPEGEGTLLDHCAVYFSSEVADGNSHQHTSMPVLLAGGGGGAISPGRHISYDNLPVANLFLSMLQMVGVTDPSFGDSTGALDGLQG